MGMQTFISLTKEDAQEVIHKLGVLADSEDLREDYGFTKAQADDLLGSVPGSGGIWRIPLWAIGAVQSEMEDHIVILRDVAADARRSCEQALRICKQAARFERMFS